MSNIRFDESRFERVRKVYGDWWAGKSERAVMGFAVKSYEPKGRAPKAGLLLQDNVDLTRPVDDILDAIEYEFSQYEFIGDAYPNYNFDCFGPGLLAAFLGARLDNSTGRVWFHPQKNESIENLSFKFDEDSVWLQRVLSIVKRGYERFGQGMIFSMPDLGGILDVLSVFLPSDELLLQLYDEPELVKKHVKSLEDLWFKYYEVIAKAAHSDEIGYTDWSGVYSAKPTYILQCDFSYMISNDMFKEFALDSLTKAADKLTNSIYHLDGINELNHLDDIVKIKSLNAVQWVPGTGQKPVTEWREVYDKILSSGKSAYMLNFGPESFETIVNQVGRENKMLYQFTLPHCVWQKEDRDYLVKYLQKFKIEV